jgi:hypothetical protein
VKSSVNESKNNNKELNKMMVTGSFGESSQRREYTHSAVAVTIRKTRRTGNRMGSSCRVVVGQSSLLDEALAIADVPW